MVSMLKPRPHLSNVTPAQLLEACTAPVGLAIHHVDVQLARVQPSITPHSATCRELRQFQLIDMSAECTMPGAVCSVGLGKLLLVTVMADISGTHAGNCLVQMQEIVNMPLMYISCRQTRERCTAGADR